MSTNDVPGYNPANHDQLAAMCWAEHDDGSLILVLSTEGDRVVYEMFDPNNPEYSYRDAMTEKDFKKAFSWKSGESVCQEKWTWRDKTPFDFNRVMKAGVKPGLRYVSADVQISAAARVAESLKLRARAITDGEYSHLVEKRVKKVEKALRKLQDAVESCPR
jgi:hypothetical protein